jgi:glycosyltransferase involved in cell wall biosynthesis
MRILLATHASLEIGGGEERFFVNLAKALRARGHAVRIANFASVFTEERRATMTAIRESLGSVEVVDILGLPVASRVLPIPGIRGTRALVDGFRWADVVVFGQYYGFDAAVHLLARGTHRPILCSQSNALFRPLRTAVRDTVQEVYARLFGWRLLLRCSAVRVCNSEDLRFLTNHGYDRAILMYPLTSEFSGGNAGGTSPAQPDGPAGRLAADVRFKVMIAGRMTHQKGVDLLAKVISLMVQRDPHLSSGMAFYLAGSSTVPRPLRRLVRDHPDLVINLGVLPRESLAPVLREANAVLVPSRYESFGTITAEAQSVGRVVIATSTTGLREVVRNNVTGLLVDEWSPGAFADALEGARGIRNSDPRRFAEMETAAKSNFESRFGPSVQNAQFEQLVSTLETLASARAARVQGDRVAPTL